MSNHIQSAFSVCLFSFVEHLSVMCSGASCGMTHSTKGSALVVHVLQSTDGAPAIIHFTKPYLEMICLYYYGQAIRNSCY